MEETEYMKKGWDNNVKNCNIDETRAIMISDEPRDFEFVALNAGVVIGELGVSRDRVEMHRCGKWIWLTFENTETAVAFKIRWL